MRLFVISVQFPSIELIPEILAAFEAIQSALSPKRRFTTYLDIWVESVEAINSIALPEHVRILNAKQKELNSGFDYFPSVGVYVERPSNPDVYTKFYKHGIPVLYFGNETLPSSTELTFVPLNESSFSQAFINYLLMLREDTGALNTLKKQAMKYYNRFCNELMTHSFTFVIERRLSLEPAS